MNILPASKKGWLNFALFPFKAYAVIVPIWVIVISHQSFYLREAYDGSTACIMWGDALCVPVFILAAIIQFLSRRRRAALMSILFAVAIVIGWFLLLPLCGLARG